MNKWSTYHEKDFYIVLDLNGSAVTARRESDGRTVHRDASKFRLFRETKNDSWMKRLLCSSRGDRSSTQNRNEEETPELGKDTEPDDDHHRPRRQTRQREEPQRRELPKRTRRLPAKFKDYVIEKSTSRQRSGKCAIRKRLPLQKPRWEKTKLTIRYLYHENIS